MAAKAENGGGGRGRAVRLVGWGGAGLLLLAPLVAMRFTDEVDWTASDFVIAAVLLGALGLGLEIAARRGRNWAHRIAAAIPPALAFLTLWVNGAVGVIGSEDEPANLLFLGVLSVALAGSLLARFRPCGMAWAMTAAAAAQACVPFLAWALDLAPLALIARPEVPTFTVVFTGLWLLSAGLFRKAAG